MDANLEMSIKLRLLIKALWNHCEGISADDIKLLCWGCGIDPSTVMPPQPTPAATQWDGNMDMESPF